MRGLAWALLMTLTVGAAQADLDTADYVGVGKSMPAGRTPEQLKSEIARDIDQEARQAQRDAEEEARRQAHAQAEEARRPYSERLLQARCTLCHPADNYLNQRHTSLGWHVVIGRMRHLNRAAVSWDEQVSLAEELARIRPARPLDAAVEYGAGLAALVAPLALGWGLNRWRRASSSARSSPASRM